jgi:hypothetical protein
MHLDFEPETSVDGMQVELKPCRVKLAVVAALQTPPHVRSLRDGIVRPPLLHEVADPFEDRVFDSIEKGPG